MKTWRNDYREVRRAYVFGSFVNGDYTPGSDLDILLVLSHSDIPFRDRIAFYYPRHFPVPIDLFPYTEAEMRNDPPVARVAVRSGVKVDLERIRETGQVCTNEKIN